MFKTKDVYKDIVCDVGLMIGLMINMAGFVGMRPKTYSYLIDVYTEEKKAKVTKKMCNNMKT